MSSRQKRGFGAAAVVVLGAVAVMVVAPVGCTIRVAPPAAPSDPTPAFLIDHGRHSSVLLPDDSALAAASDPTSQTPLPFIEYTYGEWKWFALEQNQWWRAFPTLLWPTQGTLGRREWRVRPTVEGVQQTVSGEAVLPLRVERDSVQRVRSDLEALYQRAIETAHYQPAYNLTFVHSPRPYWLARTCNDVTSQWLEALGCDVRGRALFADFALIEPQASNVE